MVETSKYAQAAAEMRETGDARLCAAAELLDEQARLIVELLAHIDRYKAAAAMDSAMLGKLMARA